MSKAVHYSNESWFSIPLVTLHVSRSPDSAGRVETFHHSLTLMRRLDQIGKRKLVILFMIDGEEIIPEIHVDALNHLLWTGSGLKYFRRTTPLSLTNGAWQQLKAKAGFPVSRLHV